MTGRGSIRHNNRSFSAANVDRSRSGQNVTFCNEDLKKVYHELFDEALAAYNAKKKKTRDKIPDYYEHIRQSKQEKLFHEAIFQIGNLTDCGCGSPGGERAAAALKEFAESFQERNPHLRVFNMVLHMDEATPHLHVDFVPVATEQSRGLSTRVSMKQALKQQGFEGLGRKQTEWKAWMEREKEALTEIAQAHEFEIISLGGSNAGWDVKTNHAFLQDLVERFTSHGIRTSIFVGTELENIEWAAKTGTDRIELYTEPYASLYPKDRDAAVAPFVEAARFAKNLGLGVNAGHDLSLENLAFFSKNIPFLDEVSIGHALICDALYLGLEETIKQYKACLEQ